MPSHVTLVTGATGFVGAYLLHFLVKNGETNLRALRRPNSPMDLVTGLDGKVEWLDADLLDLPALEDAMQGVGRVYHCAGMVSFAPGDLRQLIRVNREGTANVVNLCLDFGVEKLVHVSSIAALGRRKNETRIDENTKWQGDKWNSPYAVSKHLAEMEVWRGIAEGLNAAIVNPSNILGSGFWEGRDTTGQLFTKIWQGMPFCPQGTSGFVDVRDVVRFMVALMESDLTAERFIVNGENLPFRTVFHEIAKTLNVKPPSVEVTPFLRELAWRGAWLMSKFTGKKPFITKQTARSSARTFFYENEKGLAAFPDFRYTSIRQTVKETGKQFLENVEELRPAILPFQ